MNFKEKMYLLIINITRLLPAILLVGLLSCPVMGQEVTPEIQLGARGVMSVNGNTSPGHTSTVVNDFSDTELLLGLRQHLFSSYRGRLVLGFQFPDADADLGQVYYNQIMFELNNEKNQFRIGRTRLNSRLVDFTTLRDDDALYFTDVVNPFASGRNSQAIQYGNVLQYGHVFDQRWWLKGFAAHYTKDPIDQPSVEDDFSINGGGGSLIYRVPEAQVWNREFIQQIGLGINVFSASETIDAGKKKPLTNLQFSGILNIRRDPVNFMDLRFQALYNMGFNEIDHISDIYDYSRTRSTAAYIMVRYLRRRLEFPSFQLSAGGGVKTFPNLNEESRQYKVLANGFYRLGANFDIGVQYEFDRNTGPLASLFEKAQHILKLTLIFNADMIFNNQFDDRESLLNLEHGYIQ